MAEKLRLLAVFPHPDDETLGLGGTLAKYASEGVETYLLCATRGERGWPGTPEENPGLESLGKIREGELRCACAVLGLREVNLLDYMDGELDQAQPAEIVPKLVSHIRRIRPQVVVTFSVDGNYGHPDHIALSQFTSAALVSAAGTEHLEPGGLPPYQVPKYYHMIESESMVAALLELIGGISMEVDGIMRSQFAWKDWAISARIDIRPYFDQLWQAVLCHQSQLPGFEGFVELPKQDLMRIFSEGTFLRVYSLVNAGRRTETDLFEGLR